MFAGSRLAVCFVLLMLVGGGLLAACGDDDDDDGGGGNGGSTDPVAAEAQQLFIDVGCAECHGENGEGDGENRRTEVAGTRMIYSQFETRVRNGRGEAMPGYSEEQISDEQIEQLHEWLSSQ